MKAITIVVLSFLLTACGGGSSGGGGGAPASFAGMYGGIATITMSAPGATPQTIRGTIQFEIDGQGNITSDPGTDFSGTGTLNGNRFTVTVPASSLNEPGLRCTGAIVFTGSISGDSMNGSISVSGFVCNGVPIQVSGTFQAARLPAQGRQPIGGSLMESVRGAIL